MYEKSGPIKNTELAGSNWQTKSMRIPCTELAPPTLRAIVEKFVTRDGTDHSSVEQRVESVLRQLHVGCVELHFDDQTKTCNIVILGAY